MYDSNYFRKIIGENVNPNDYFENSSNISNSSARIIDENTYMKNQSVFIQNQNSGHKEEQTQSRTNTQNQAKIQSQINEQTNITRQQINTQEQNNIQVKNEQSKNISRAGMINVENLQSEKTIQSNHTIYDHYPEIYKIIMPMVEEAVKRNSGQNITSKLIEGITTEIFNALEVDNNINKNKVLYDLIKILVLNYFVNNFIMTSTIPNPYPEDL